MKTIAAILLLLIAVPVAAQDKPKPDVELLILRARVDVLQDALTAATAQIKILQAQAAATGEIANQRFAETRARWEPELLRAHGHVGDGWTWDWEKWVPAKPEPKPEAPKEPEKK